MKDYSLIATYKTPSVNSTCIILTMAPTLGLYVILLAVTTISGYLVINDPRIDECSRTGPKCSSDCKKVIFCASKGGDPLEVTTCDTDFCHVPVAAEGEVAYPECGGTSCKSDEFLCLAPGGLPDPTNTTGYYLCPGIYLDGIRVQCPAGQSFDVLKRGCASTDDAIVIEIKECTAETVGFGKLDANDVFCSICNAQGNILPYPCALEEDKERFFGIAYQLPSN